MKFDLFHKYLKSDDYSKFDILKGVIEEFNIPTLKYFIQRDAEIVSEYNGDSILHNACYFGCLDCIKLILKYNLVDIDKRDKQLRTPLHMAIIFDRDNCVEYLLKRGANKEAITITGETPISLAKSRNNKKIIDLLEKTF